MSLGERIKYSRIRNKLTQKELANKVGVAQNTISCYEKNTKPVSLEMINKLCVALDESKEYFLIEDTVEKLKNLNIVDNENVIEEYIDWMIDKGKIKDQDTLDKYKDALWDMLKNDILDKLNKKKTTQ